MGCRNCRSNSLQLPVWSFWTGAQPATIALCVETLRRNSPTAVVLDETYWRSRAYYGAIPPDRILRLAPNLQSDVLRAWLLFSRGGVWIDADAIVWRDLRGIGRYLRRHDFVCYRGRHGLGLCSALIAARPHSAIAAAYWRAVCERVSVGRLRELSLGPRLLRRVIAAHRKTPIRYLRSRLVHPVPPRRSATLLQDQFFVPPRGSWTFMLTHRPLRAWANLDRETILNSSTLLGRLFARALHYQPAKDTLP